MLVIAFLAGFFLLWLYHGYALGAAAAGALAGSVLGTITELLSPSEWDTVTVPVIILIVLLLVL